MFDTRKVETLVQFSGGQHLLTIHKGQNSETANWYSDGYELRGIRSQFVLFYLCVDFISRLIDHNRVDILTHLKFTLRFVDDLLSCDNPIFNRYMYLSQTDSSGMRGIYPSFLTLKREQLSDVEVSFLDVLVYRAGDVFSTKTYDKREHPPLSAIKQLKYPHPSCFLSDRSKYGIITSRFWSFGRICKRKCDFKARAKKCLL